MAGRGAVVRAAAGVPEPAARGGRRCGGCLRAPVADAAAADAACSAQPGPAGADPAGAPYLPLKATTSISCYDRLSLRDRDCIRLQYTVQSSTVLRLSAQCMQRFTCRHCSSWHARRRVSRSTLRCCWWCRRRGPSPAAAMAAQWDDRSLQAAASLQAVATATRRPSWWAPPTTGRPSSCGRPAARRSGSWQPPCSRTQVRLAMLQCAGHVSKRYCGDLEVLTGHRYRINR